MNDAGPLPHLLVLRSQFLRTAQTLHRRRVIAGLRLIDGQAGNQSRVRGDDRDFGLGLDNGLGVGPLGVVSTPEVRIGVAKVPIRDRTERAD